MKFKILKICILFFVLAGLLSACSVKKYIKEDEYLVGKYRLTIENSHSGIKQSELRSLLRPKPNARFLGSHWKLHNYYKAIEKPSKFNKWLNKSFGEYPVIYEDDLGNIISRKMISYLNNVGFFNSKVSYSVEYDERVAKLNFTVIPARPYIISEVSYDIADSLIANFFFQKSNQTLVKKGDIYNAYTFDNERDRITKELRDVGYYYFNRNYIQFIVDSAFTDHEMTVVLKINRIKEQVDGISGEFIEKNHKRYFVKNIEVIPDWKPISNPKYDTVPHRIKFWNDDKDYTYNFLLDKKARIKPEAFNSAIQIKPGRPYSATAVAQTYQNLFNFVIIRTATINYDTTNAGKNEEENYGYLNSTIQMQTAKLNSFKAELEGTNSSGDLGVRGNVVLANRNIFKRADVFSIRLNGGFEAQSVNSDIEGSYDGLFNTFEAGISGNFYFPRFLFPGRLTKFNQKYSPVTNINFGFNFQKRQNYDRNITNLDLGYSWNQTKQIKHVVTPIAINYVKYVHTTYFQDSILDTLTNRRLKEQYSDHFVAGLRYSFIYNNQNLKALEHFNYFRADISTSGNLLNVIYNAFNIPPTTFLPDTDTIATNPSDTITVNTLFGVPYSQFIRINFDYRHYYYFLNKTNSIAFRVLLGFGVAYNNSAALPYEESFFAGGANDMRGWEFRKLGPGAYSGTNDYERAGDIQIEANAEYRFPIYRFLKGALFLDVGNIWTLKINNNNNDSNQLVFPQGDITNNWYQQLAIDVGVGTRFDFNFFIFRIDFAMPLVNPAYWTEEGGAHLSIPQGLLIGDTFIANFGIGYPF